MTVERRETDRYSQSGGGSFTASLRLGEERLIGQPDAVLERGRGAPAELGQVADIEQFSRGAVGARGVKADLATVTDGRRDHAGEFGDRDVLAGADIDQLIAGIGFHQMDAGIREIIDIEEFAPRRAGAPDHDLVCAGYLGFVET